MRTHAGGWAEPTSIKVRKSFGDRCLRSKNFLRELRTWACDCFSEAENIAKYGESCTAIPKFEKTEVDGEGVCKRCGYYAVYMFKFELGGKHIRRANSQKDVGAIIRLWQQGYACNSIARSLGMSKWTVRSFIRGLK